MTVFMKDISCMLHVFLSRRIKKPAGFPARAGMLSNPCLFFGLESSHAWLFYVGSAVGEYVNVRVHGNRNEQEQQ